MRIITAILIATCKSALSSTKAGKILHISEDFHRIFRYKLLQLFFSDILLFKNWERQLLVSSQASRGGKDSSSPSARET